MADQHNRTPGSSWRPVTQAELLQWSVLNTATAGEDTTAATEPAQREPIDPKWVDVLLGKGDALRMKECVETVANTDLSVDERIEAFDELELLVESLDNANDLRSLKLWAPIIAQLSSDIARLRMYAPGFLARLSRTTPHRRQTYFLNAGGLEPVLRLLEQDEDAEVRAKALYCISGESIRCRDHHHTARCPC
ncbi:nucleotide exchange factor Fes1-domain-containing protein, partial [Entophlyctis helioformis]